MTAQQTTPEAVQGDEWRGDPAIVLASKIVEGAPSNRTMDGHCYATPTEIKYMARWILSHATSPAALTKDREAIARLMFEAQMGMYAGDSPAWETRDQDVKAQWYLCADKFLSLMGPPTAAALTKEVDGFAQSRAPLLASLLRHIAKTYEIAGDDHYTALNWADELDGLRHLRASAAAPQESADRDARQREVHEWCAAAFGADHAASLPQRGIRHVEEAIEAAQAAGCERAMVLKLVDYVFDRPAGELRQEIGGSGLTLLALAQAASISADEAECAEIARVKAKPLEHFAKRNRVKNDAGFNTSAPPSPAPQSPATRDQE